jgi:hypothetical protein
LAAFLNWRNSAIRQSGQVDFVAFHEPPFLPNGEGQWVVLKLELHGENFPPLVHPLSSLGLAIRVQMPRQFRQKPSHHGCVVSELARLTPGFLGGKWKCLKFRRCLNPENSGETRKSFQAIRGNDPETIPAP